MNYSDHDQCVGLVYDLDKYVNVASSALAMFNDELKTFLTLQLSLHLRRKAFDVTDL